jgi:predicted neutral ceramidase superfamily lipid hydrolase
MKSNYKEYLKLNKNIFFAFLASVIISAIFAQIFSLQAKYVNSSITLAIDLSVYYAVFSGFFYIDNNKKYLLESGKLDKSRLKTDLFKIITSLGLSEIIYVVCRWLLQYYLLTGNYEAYASSVLAQSISFIVYLICVNLIARSVMLYKDKE